MMIIDDDDDEPSGYVIGGEFLEKLTSGQLPKAVCAPLCCPG
jgi:hypothetical protein